MVEKLSQFNTTSSPPALTDYVAGASVGPPNLRYTLAQVGAAATGITVATGNITWYVSPTGSDSNNGLTTGTAFATLQHAVNVAVNVNFQNLYQPTIQILDGNYTGNAAGANIPPLLNTLQLNIVLATTPSLSDPTKVTSDGFINAMVDPAQTVSFSSCSGTFSSTFPFNCSSGILSQFECTIKFTTPSGLFCYFAESESSQEGGSTAWVNLVQCTFDFTAINQLQRFFSGNGSFDMVDCFVNFPASTFTLTGGWLNVLEGSYVRWHHPTYTNASFVTGQRIRGLGGGVFVSFTGCQADVPGTVDGPTASNFIMQADHLVAGTNTLSPVSSNSLAGNYTAPPAPLNVPALSGGTGDIISNCWGVYVDRTNGQRWLAVNDAGLNPVNSNVVGTVYVKQIGRVPNTQTASYTLALIDQDGRVEMNVAGANTLTVPPNASVAFPVTTEVRITQTGAGATTITAGAGVTVHNAGAIPGGQWNSVKLYQRAANEWVQTNS